MFRFLKFVKIIKNNGNFVWNKFSSWKTWNRTKRKSQMLFFSLIFREASFSSLKIHTWLSAFNSFALWNLWAGPQIQPWHFHVLHLYYSILVSLYFASKHILAGSASNRTLFVAIYSQVHGVSLKYFPLSERNHKNDVTVIVKLT